MISITRYIDTNFYSVIVISTLVLLIDCRSPTPHKLNMHVHVSIKPQGHAEKDRMEGEAAVSQLSKAWKFFGSQSIKEAR